MKAAIQWKLYESKQVAKIRPAKYGGYACSWSVHIGASVIDHGTFRDKPDIWPRFRSYSWGDWNRR